MEKVHTLGMIGLGRMGNNMRSRLREGGINVVGYDEDVSKSDVGDLRELVATLRESSKKVTIWLMLPLFAYEDVLRELGELLKGGDVIIDGGNSRWQDTQQRAADWMRYYGVRYIDCGTSGGVWGLHEGYAVMVGCSEEEYEAILPVLKALAPQKDGVVRAGGSGAGHYAKEIHNGIEYGMMQALGEGYELLDKSPLIEDPSSVYASWRNGSVVRSWLLDLAVLALQNEEFTNIAAVAADSGEGRWTLHDAIDLGVSIPVISAAVLARFASQGNGDEGIRLVAALRQQFGGHAVTETK